jgi:hypothetical protein
MSEGEGGALLFGEDDGEGALLDSADAGEDGLQGSAQTVDDVLDLAEGGLERE